MIFVKIIFKIYRLIFRRPCRSEVRLVLDNMKAPPYNLTYSAAVLYIFGESVYEISEWFGVDEAAIVDALNKITGED